MNANERKLLDEEYNVEPIIAGNKNVWFLNGDLVRPHHTSRSTGMITFYNITQDRMETCFVSDFKRNRERAYTVGETAKLVNRHKKYMPSLIKRGVIPPPIGSSKDGKTGWQIRSYYRESQVREIRDILATHNMGRPRKDGLINNNVTPTIQELNRRMGDGLLTYIKTADGQFSPSWNETV